MTPAPGGFAPSPFAAPAVEPEPLLPTPSLEDAEVALAQAQATKSARLADLESARTAVQDLDSRVVSGDMTVTAGDVSAAGGEFRLAEARVAAVEAALVKAQHGVHAAQIGAAVDRYVDARPAAVQALHDAVSQREAADAALLSAAQQFSGHASELLESVRSAGEPVGYELPGRLEGHGHTHRGAVRVDGEQVKPVDVGDFLAVLHDRASRSAGLPPAQLYPQPLELPRLAK